jgi:hypothetical protein
LCTAAVLLAACSNAPVPVTLPQKAGNATLAGPSAAVQPVPAEWTRWRGTSGATRAWQAKYTGPPDIALTLLEMPSSAKAFDAFQMWQNQAGTMAFYKGQFFGVAESPGADMQTLNRFLLAIEAVLPPGDEFRR